MAIFDTAGFGNDDARYDLSLSAFHMFVISPELYVVSYMECIVHDWGGQAEASPIARATNEEIYL